MIPHALSSATGCSAKPRSLEKCVDICYIAKKCFDIGLVTKRHVLWGEPL